MVVSARSPFLVHSNRKCSETVPNLNEIPAISRWCFADISIHQRADEVSSSWTSSKSNLVPLVAMLH